MPVCSKCGTSNEPTSNNCTRCGSALQVRARPAAAQTMLGLASPASTSGPAAAKQTLLGLNAKDLYGAMAAPPANAANASRPATAPAAGSATAASKSFDPKRTLMGVGTPTPSSVPPAGDSDGLAVGRSTQLGHSPGERLPAPELSSTAILHPGVDRAAVGGTLLGMPAANMPAGSNALGAGGTLIGSAASNMAAASSAGTLAGGRAPAPSLGQGTLLGVAAPAVTSGQHDHSHPGKGNAAAANSHTSSDDATPAHGRSSAPPVISAAPLVDTDLDADWRPRARRQRQSAAVLLGAAAFVLIALVGFVAFWDPAPPLRVRLAADPTGVERLEFTCMDCPAGSHISFGGHRGEFDGQTATVAVDAPLPIGDNDIEVSLERGGMGRDESIALSVPVHSRVQADVTPLRQGKTAIDVLVEAKPDAQVSVDGKAVDLGDGSARVPYELGDAIVGESSDNEHFERSVPYSIRDGEKPMHEGSLLVRLPIVPLSVDTPRRMLVTESERFMLAGQTAPGAKITVAGSPIQVAADGSFAQLMSIDSVGETTITIRADVDGHAPRLVRIAMKRVTSLAQEGKTFAEPIDYSNLLAAATAGNERQVALEVQVDEARDKRHSSVLLSHVTSGCMGAPCLVQVHSAQPYRGKKGDTLRVFGVVSGRIDGPSGKPIPVVDTAFTLD